jgi:hypothetical protein
MNSLAPSGVLLNKRGVSISVNPKAWITARRLEWCPLVFSYHGLSNNHGHISKPALGFSDFFVEILVLDLSIDSDISIPRLPMPWYHPEGMEVVELGSKALFHLLRFRKLPLPYPMEDVSLNEFGDTWKSTYTVPCFVVILVCI